MKKPNIHSRDWYYIQEPEQREQLAKKVGVCENHLRHVMVGTKKAGRTLAIMLEMNTPYSRYYFRPDVFGTEAKEEVAA